MRVTRIITVAAGLVSGTALAVTILQFSAASQPEGVVQEPNPCEGQTDEGCNKTIDRLRSEGNAKYINWVNDFIASGQDPRELPRSPSSAIAPESPQSLDVAVARADIILTGVVTEATFEVVPPDDPSGFAFVRGKALIAIENTLRGTAAKEIAILQFGGPEPNSDWKTGSLLYLEAAPLLLEGDRALLFIKKDELGYSVQAWTGTYLVDNEDKVDAIAGNPFEASVEAKTLSEFSEEIGALVAKQAQSAR